MSYVSVVRLLVAAVHVQLGCSTVQDVEHSCLAGWNSDGTHARASGKHVLYVPYRVKAGART